MKIITNAIPLRVAGGRSVATNFFRAFRDGPFEHEMVAYVPSGQGYEDLAGGRLTIKTVPGSFDRGSMRLWIDHVWWKNLLRREAGDVLFSMGSIALPTTLPQLVLFHWPYAIYPDANLWRRMDRWSRTNRLLRRRLFRQRIRHATLVAAQTETARARLEKQYGLLGVRVVPNAVALPPLDEGPDLALPCELPPRPRLLCLSRYYPHKNLEILVPLARRIRDRGAEVSLITTMGTDDHPAVSRILEQVRSEGLSEILVNVGTVPMEQIGPLYRACDGLLMPTLLESFSGTYIEAMHYGLPIFTSARDFAFDVCGDDAYYFDPQSPEHIFSVITAAFADPEQMNERLARGRARAAEIPSWPDVAAAYLALLEEIAVAPR